MNQFSGPREVCHERMYDQLCPMWEARRWAKMWSGVLLGLVRLAASVDLHGMRSEAYAKVPSMLVGAPLVPYVGMCEGAGQRLSAAAPWPCAADRQAVTRCCQCNIRLSMYRFLDIHTLRHQENAEVKVLCSLALCDWPHVAPHCQLMRL